MDCEAEIRTYIATEDLLIHQDARTIAADFPLLEMGVLDSLGLFQLIRFLEKHFRISVDWKDLNKARFNSIADIVELVEMKISAHALTT